MDKPNKGKVKKNGTKKVPNKATSSSSGSSSGESDGDSSDGTYFLMFFVGHGIFQSRESKWTWEKFEGGGCADECVESSDFNC